MSKPVDQQQTDSGFGSAGTPWRTWVLGVLLVAPVLASGWYQLSGQQSSVLKIESTRPSLLFSTYLYHHGEQPIEATSRLETEFRFRNDGDQPVHISKVERSCGCMNPMLSSQDINPGEIGALMVPISTVNEQPGPKDFVLTVHYNDPVPRKATLTIKAVFPEQMIIVKPKALFLSQRTSIEIPFDVQVSDHRDRKLEVTSVISTASFVNTTLTQAQSTAMAPAPDPAFEASAIEAPIFDEPSGAIQRVGYQTSESQPSDKIVLLGEADSSPVSEVGNSATINGIVQGDLPPGRHHVLVAAETSDPDMPVITVPMMITGPSYPVGEEVQLTTSMIQLVASDAPEAYRTGHVAMTAPADWEFAEPQVWPEQLKVSLKTSPTPEPGRATSIIKVELTDLPSSQLKEGVVSIPTKDGKNLVTVKIGFLWP